MLCLKRCLSLTIRLDQPYSSTITPAQALATKVLQEVRTGLWILPTLRIGKRVLDAICELSFNFKKRSYKDMFSVFGNSFYCCLKFAGKVGSIES